MSEMIFRTASLFVFSGTGNTYRAATWLQAQARQAGLATTLCPTNAPGDLSDLPLGCAHLLGLLSPTHGFTAPWHMLKFATRLPAGHGTGAFVLVTRAGTKFGRLFLPGMEGTAAYLLGFILLLKGYRLRGVLGLDMPSNWLAVHPGFSMASAEALMKRAQPTAECFLTRILAGRKTFGYATFICLALGLAMAQVSLAYLLLGRLMLAKLFFASTACTGCGQCARDCPVGAIRLWGRRHPRPYWLYGCESCMRCMAYCPTRAIQASHSLAVLLWILTSVPLSSALPGWLSFDEVSFEWLRQALGFWLVQYPFTLLSTAVAYGLFTLLLRLPPINYLFTYTTLTRWYRRYHAPGVTSDDLRGTERRSVDGEHLS